MSYRADVTAGSVRIGRSLYLYGVDAIGWRKLRPFHVRLVTRYGGTTLSLRTFGRFAIVGIRHA